MTTLEDIRQAAKDDLADAPQDNSLARTIIRMITESAYLPGDATEEDEVEFARVSAGKVDWAWRTRGTIDAYVNERESVASLLVDVEAVGSPAGTKEK